MHTVTAVRKGADDVYADAKKINERRAGDCASIWTAAACRCARRIFWNTI